MEEHIDVLLSSLRTWSDKLENPQEEKVKKMIEEYFLFTPPDSFIRLMAALPPGYGLTIGYELQFMESLDDIFQTMSYTECFYEFYTLTHLVPLLNHGDGRIYDLYDCETGCILQFNILDPPSEWIVLAKSFDQVLVEYFEALQRFKLQIPLPDSIYQKEQSNESFQTLHSLFPDRGIELDSILPRPLVLVGRKPNAQPSSGTDGCCTH